MQAARDQFLDTLTRFQGRVVRISPQALAFPRDDADERAAMTLLMSSAFEGFLRDATQACVMRIPSIVANFHNLPKQVRRTHYEGGAAIVGGFAKSDWKDVAAARATAFVSAEEIIQRLASSASQPYSLVWEAFAQTGSNAGSDTVGKILQRFEVEKPWPTLAANVPPGDFAIPPGPARENKISTELNELRVARNRCAHGLATAAAPQWSVLLGFAAALRATAIGFVDTLESRLVTL
jgi:hypothetical protein